MLRRDCRWYMAVGGNALCKAVWEKNILSEPKYLKLGCDEDGRCEEYVPLPHRRALLTESQQEELEEDERRDEDPV